MEFNEIKDILYSFPRIDLGIHPTPLQRLYNMEKKTEYSSIYMKRDDLNGLGIGGNKVRNLEYLLGDAISKNADTIIVSGHIQSNLCSLTAAACRKLNIHCIVVHNNKKPNKLVGNAMLNSILNADIRYIGDVSMTERSKYIEDLKQDLERSNKHPYIILNGASTPLGSLGYVQAAVEIYEQIKNGSLDIKNICVPGGNGGLAAGIIFGAGIIGKPFHIDLITVEHEKKELLEIIECFIKELITLTKIKFPYDLSEVATIHDAYRDGGWGITSEKVVKFIYEFAQTEGIFVEKVYTGKTLYGMNDMIKNKYFKAGVCYLHSGGIGALFSQF